MQNGSLENTSKHQSSSTKSVPALTQIIKQEDVLQNPDVEPPAKKRKLAGTTPTPKTLPRPISPPWRTVAADGPTSFVEDGRRKSSRNAMALGLQPQSATRRTRAAAHKVERSKGNLVPRSHTPMKHETGAETRTPSSGRPAQSGPGRPVSLKEPFRKPPSRRQNQTEIKTSGVQTSKSTGHKYPLDAEGDACTHEQQPIKQHKRPERGAHPPYPSTLNSSKLSTGLNGPTHPASDNDDSKDTEPKAVESLPKVRLQKITFTVRMPAIVVQSPANIPQTKRHTSFQDFLEHDELDPKIGEGALSSQQVTKEAHIRRRVDIALRRGGTFEKELNEVLPERQKEPIRQYFHHDHLLAHALHFRKLLQAEHQKHKSDAKRIAYEAVRSVRARIPKSTEEIEQEQTELGAARYRQVVKDLMRFWSSVEAEVNSIRQSEIDIIEQAQKMREFNEQVEKHTRMLVPRMTTDTPVTPDVDQSSNCTDDSMESFDDEREDNMLSSDSTSEPDANTDDVDASLTAEQLREKYASLPASGEAATEDNESIHTSTELPSPNVGVSEPVALDQVDRGILDDDSESIDTDDGEGSDRNSPGRNGTEEDAEVDQESARLRSLSRHQALDDTAGVIPVSSMEHFREYRGEAAGGRSLPGRKDTENALPDNASEITPKQSSLFGEKAGSLSNPARETLMEDHNSLEFSTPASPRTSITKASDGDSFTSSDVRADSQLPVTPVKADTFHVKTSIPSLLRGTLRKYQHEGLDWLADLYANHRNGILADEMGLGKTIQTIALLAHLAVEHHVWGPHLIIVPSSVLLNWEMEFKKFCPGFKVLTYYGSQAERKQKRRGWMDNDLWHVIITSYQLVLQDQKNFKRRNWHYMILDEAHNIKNFRSQRWQTMLTFKTRARLLLTGTPLQNSLTELWSLLFFLRPTDMAEGDDDAFAGLSDFSDWFRKPIDQILDQGRDTMDDEARDQVTKLHKVIRPYLLRRLKADVEKQMPAKYEHVELCRLSKRQRQLYDGFMSRTKTRETLASGNYLSIIDCLMQLRKVCNHPDLFETRPVTTSFSMPEPVVADFEIKDFLIRRRLVARWDKVANLEFLRLAPVSIEDRSAIEVLESSKLMAFSQLEALRVSQQSRLETTKQFARYTVSGALDSLENNGRHARMAELNHSLYQEYFHSCERSLYGFRLLSQLSVSTTNETLSCISDEKSYPRFWESSIPSVRLGLVQSVQHRAALMQPLIQRFGCVTPAVVAPNLAASFLSEEGKMALRQFRESGRSDPFHEARTRLSIAFPDKRLLQYDCGKLQRLDKLLRELQAGGHRALIFTQMTKVLDILEQFLNIHGHRYLRLDGSTKIEQRQILTERFNNDTQFLAFILSSRSGGLGINLTGADTVIFYDLDWNPAMDKQCQDRCHRIGQTRDVHIYRFVSEHTIESNILRKSNQKRMLDDVVIQEGDFTTDYFNKISVRDMLGNDIGGIDEDANAALDKVLGSAKGGLGAVLETAEDKEDAAAAKFAEREDRHADDGDFEEKIHSHEPSATPRTPGPQTPGEDRSTDRNGDGGDGIGRVPYLNRAVRDLDEWVVESMVEWKNQELGEIKAETLARMMTGDKRGKKKKAREHRLRRPR